MLKRILYKLLDRQDLTADECILVLRSLTDGSVAPSIAGALLTALRMKGESAAELAAGAAMLRSQARFINTGARECTDLVGTGGDGGRTFNISTTSAIAAAGAGVSIAKHGNRAVSGKSGSADVLAALGYNLDAAPEKIEDGIQEYGIGFLFAQKMHPVMGNVAALRKELGIRTIFNLLGPLANPAGAKFMIVGVFDSILVEVYAEALRTLGVHHALVVHGEDGLDEITCCGNTRIAELKNGIISTYELYPEMLIGEVFDPTEIAGGSPEENAAITSAVLRGTERGAPRAAVLLNAGAACYVSGLTNSIKEAIPLVEDAIDSGNAFRKLQNLIEGSRS